MKTRMIAGVTLALALLCAGTGVALSHETHTAQAAETVTLTTENASLFLPAEYEEYLALENPTDIAFCARYVAVAEGTNLYVLDRKAETVQYRLYTHTYPISKIQFTSEGKLFFSDSNLGFFELKLDGETLTPSDSLTALSTFLIEGDTIFMASVTESGTQYAFAPLSSPSSTTPFGKSDSRNTPKLAYLDGALYAIVGAYADVYLKSDNTYRRSENPVTLNANAGEGLRSVTALGGLLYYTIDAEQSETDGLYVFNPVSQGEKNRQLIAEGGFGALTASDGKLYVAAGTSVREYEMTEDGVGRTLYEISAASSSEHRLSGAEDSVRAGDLLVTADTGNSRISVYDMRKNRFTVIPTEYAPTLVATDGQIVAAAAENAVYTYACDNIGNWSERTEDRVVLEAADPVKGIACVFGKVYFASEHHRGETGHYQLISGGTPAGLASDLYGDLFLAMSDRSVFRFTEEEFCGNSSGKQLEFTLPEGFTSLRSDFEGNLYCLDAEGTFYWNGEAYAEIDGADYVYMQEDKSVPAVSFALGYESDEVYFLFHTFMVKTNAGELGFPSLGTIGAEDIYENTGRVQEPDAVTYVDVQSGAVGIEVDLSLLTAETAYFPYAAYSRTSESGRGVLLAETKTGNYCLVALYKDNAYDVRLFRSEQCTPVGPTFEEGEGTYFLAGDTYLYNYPCLTAAKAQEPLPRGTKLSLLTVVRPDEGGEHGGPFAFVEWQGASRAAVQGYVPLSFLTEVDPAGEVREDFVIGKLKTEGEVVFTAEDGSETALHSGTAVRLFAREDGSYEAHYTDENGKEYTAVISANQVEIGASEAWRIALIVTLAVLACIIIGAAVYLIPRKPKN